MVYHTVAQEQCSDKCHLSFFPNQTVPEVFSLRDGAFYVFRFTLSLLPKRNRNRVQLLLESQIAHSDGLVLWTIGIRRWFPRDERDCHQITERILASRPGGARPRR